MHECFFFQAEDGIRDLVRSRGLGDVYKRQRQRDAPPRHGRRGVDLGGATERADGFVVVEGVDLSLIHI